MNYIGIRGHRGAGKTAISYLLGNIMECMINKGIDYINTTEFDKSYNEWCDNILKDPLCINETLLRSIYFESFSDNIKLFMNMLFGCEEYMYSDQYKNNTVINLKDFTFHNISDIDGKNVYNPDELYKLRNKEYITDIKSDTYILISDFILYFGFYIMQRFFGKHVWVRSLKSTSCKFDDDFFGTWEYKIFIDLKTPQETQFIKSFNGIIIDIIRPNNRKSDTVLDESKKLLESDYTLIVNGDLRSVKEDIINIAKDIFNKNANIKKQK